MKKMINLVIVGVVAVVVIMMMLNRGEISRFLEDRLKEKIYQESGIAEDVEKLTDKIELGTRLNNLSDEEIIKVKERYLENMSYFEDHGYDVSSEEIQIMLMRLALE